MLINNALDKNRLRFVYKKPLTQYIGVRLAMLRDLA